MCIPALCGLLEVMGGAKRHTERRGEGVRPSCLTSASAMAIAPIQDRRSDQEEDGQSNCRN